MFALANNHPRTRSVTTHSSREVARAELARFLNDATAHRQRVIRASCTHASYEILGHGDRVIGHPAIDELCACTHTEREHGEMGCTAISFEEGPFAECRCSGHRPVCAEPELFTSEVPT
jgi:hypothetical protein